jgi:hypothetical protein
MLEFFDHHPNNGYFGVFYFDEIVYIQDCLNNYCLFGHSEKLIK